MQLVEPLQAAREKEAPRKGRAILVAEDLRKVYDSGSVRVEALRGVNLRVVKGELLAIMGPSGCGKTTLLNCLSGIDDVSEGRVLVDGCDLASLSDNERTDLRARKMGFIFQSYNLLPVLTAAENVEMPLLIAGWTTRQARERALEALAIVGLEAEADKKPAQMSGGQQQRVAIARSLVNNPDIVFGDEPTGNLDSETAQEVMAVIKGLNRQRGLTFIIVTHAADVGKMADRIITMRSGWIEKQFVPTPF
jgi:putative ABC transport system ATP-binding protein